MESITGNAKIDATLNLMGLLVPLLSALASIVNHFVRVQTDSGKAPNALLLGAGSVLNIASVNLDKGVQFAKMAMGKTPPHTDATVVAPDAAAGSKPSSPSVP